MRSIVILGAGELGGAVARQLAAADVASRVVMVDEAGRVAEGKALDIRQASPNDRFSTLVDGTRDESAVVGADVVILADRAGAVEGTAVEWQDDGGAALVRRIVQANAQALLLCAGASHMDLVQRGVREAGIPQHRLIGSAPEALRAAVIGMAALEAACAPGEISLTVLGRPPGEIIVPWDAASIGGRRATEVLTPTAIARLEARLPKLWPPGPFALAAAATRLLRQAATRGRGAVSAFVAVRRGEGDLGRVAMMPVVMSSQRVAEIIVPSLSVRDRVRFETVLSRSWD